MPDINFSDIQSIRDFKSLIRFLRKGLNWPVDEETPAEDLTFDYQPAELGLEASQAARLRAICQLRPLAADQPWGIFLIETAAPRGYTAELRRLLRILAPRARARFSHLPHWQPENLLFLITCDYRQFTFAHFRVDTRAPARSKLAAFGWDESQSGLRTLLEYNLPPLAWPAAPGDSQAWLAQWASAFDVEKVTRAFFRDYRALFEQAEASITIPAWSAEQKRLYTQRFFNRLLFVAFLERKGWLTFGGRRDYLRALFDDYLHNDPEKRREANFHRKRLNTLFFMGLNNPYGRSLLQDDPQYQSLRALIGDVPYLHGGLFEREADDETFFFPDEISARILSDLVYRYNFTVTESTPLDVEVAVDPEMLGKIFEELVTGRHESGSYYTPKPVVQFMCREALKAYLETALPHEQPQDIARFVDEDEGAALRDPEAALTALRQVKVCDPACGSGAYLLGMLHELLEKREALFAARSLDALTVYQRKLEIIQNNLYGVDKDNFAVNIARLRLWLSLIVDFEGETPPPLPNLDFKIECGDSLTAPDPSGGLQPDLFRYGQVQEFLRLKNEFMSVHAGSDEKKALAGRIEELKRAIKAWAHLDQASDLPNDSFDWQVEFAEVFAPDLAPAHPAGGTGQGKAGGFDIVLTNPPYVRQELIKDLKPALKRVYGDLFVGTADLYVYFYLRAHQLLRPDGAACFISSNKWLRAGYGEKLRQHLLDEQAFRLVVDFGELPVFQTAATFPAIFLWQKRPRGQTPTRWAVVKNLQRCYDEGIAEHTARIGQSLPAEQFGRGKARLTAPATADLRRRMDARGTPLGEYVQGKIYFGIKTGFNEAFLLDEEARQRLLEQDPAGAEIIKPLLVGDDVRRYEIHYRGRYLIWTYIGVPIERYPAIFAHLKNYQTQLEQRWDKGEHWWELRACDYYAAFEQPKIIYPEIAREKRFFLDREQFFPLKTVFSIGLEDWYLLAVLNSMPGWEYLKQVCNVLGDENQGGRLTLQAIYVEKLPIPESPPAEREAIAALAQQAQHLHMQRRARVEQFLRAIGIDPARSSSRNPLEQPWALSEEEFTRRAGRDASRISTYRKARQETLSLTEEALRVEREIDERVKALYGL